MLERQTVAYASGTTQAQGFLAWDAAVQGRRPGRIRGKVLVCHGAQDPLAKPEAIATFRTELQRDKVDWQFVYYGNAAHSFTDPTADTRNSPAFAYNELAERRSWALMLSLFQETFG